MPLSSRNRHPLKVPRDVFYYFHLTVLNEQVFFPSKITQKHTHKASFVLNNNSTGPGCLKASYH